MAVHGSDKSQKEVVVGRNAVICLRQSRNGGMEPMLTVMITNNPRYQEGTAKQASMESALAAIEKWIRRQHELQQHQSQK